jgi:hypothetical protein
VPSLTAGVTGGGAEGVDTAAGGGAGGAEGGAEGGGAAGADGADGAAGALAIAEDIESGMFFSGQKEPRPLLTWVIG